MKKCPEVGGDTLWANMFKAYDELSAPLKDLCEGLAALHDAGPHLAPERKVIHPVVRVHPVTGRKSLFVDEHFTRRFVELSHDESDVLLRHLTRWVASMRFTVRYRWTEGTVAIWDNRCTQHHVLSDFEGERIIQRVTVMGDEPRAAAPPRWEPFRKAFSAANWQRRAAASVSEGARLLGARLKMPRRAQTPPHPRCRCCAHSPELRLRVVRAPGQRGAGAPGTRHEHLGSGS